MGSRRFYVGNLSTEVKDNDINKLFAKFGIVDKIEIKRENLKLLKNVNNIYPAKRSASGLPTGFT